MSREILFRGKAINRKPNYEYRTNYRNGDWVYGLLTDAENYAGFAEMTNTDGVSGIDVDKDTIGQYTGLTDKNGNKIFEGDIIFFEDESPSNYEYHDCTEMRCGEVKFDDAQFYLTNRIAVEMSDLIYDGTLEGEVIGNIHDNPELLKGGAEE